MKKRLAALFALTALLCPPLSGAQAAEVNLITDFGFNGRHAYFYVALDKGYYKAEGLDVNILRGQGSADAIKKVASGAATMGFADAGSLVLARGNDKVPVKMVAIVYATPPQAIFTLTESGITAPKDLEGKTLADTASSSVRLLFPAYAEAAGIDASKVNWVTADGASLSSVLATKRADGIGQFLVGQPLVEKATAPNPVTALAYKDAGLNFYSNGLIASEDTIAGQPEMVRAFVRATLKGMKDAFADPAEAAAIMHGYQKQIDPAVIEGETRLVKELATVPGQPLGKIDPARVKETVDVVSKYFKLNAPVDPKDVVVEGFVE
ncbi:ABC transporter substrate-binding protein [Ancylobacter pratisalsi]|uniref:ABC transporter substrate-binding protein n=1 Tax=Ancylobacter pratisalsi TaxID=1745854 RepID=A0A6P1YR75_9HYPH|nr:ABC transporter substrate-binding protein [Ancylobacter pratisalsi]QIB34244.1 ABC transporter substrate-binding protein [Ancylobacter pratisalsi]